MDTPFGLDCISAIKESVFYKTIFQWELFSKWINTSPMMKSESWESTFFRKWALFFYLSYQNKKLSKDEKRKIFQF